MTVLLSVTFLALAGSPMEFSGRLATVFDELKTGGYLPDECTLSKELRNAPIYLRIDPKQARFVLAELTGAKWLAPNQQAFGLDPKALSRERELLRQATIKVLDNAIASELRKAGTSLTGPHSEHAASLVSSSVDHFLKRNASEKDPPLLPATLLALRLLHLVGTQRIVDLPLLEHCVFSANPRGGQRSLPNAARALSDYQSFLNLPVVEAAWRRWQESETTSARPPATKSTEPLNLLLRIVRLPSSLKVDVVVTTPDGMTFDRTQVRIPLEQPSTLDATDPDISGQLGHQSPNTEDALSLASLLTALPTVAPEVTTTIQLRNICKNPAHFDPWSPFLYSLLRELPYSTTTKGLAFLGDDRWYGRWADVVTKEAQPSLLLLSKHNAISIRAWIKNEILYVAPVYPYRAMLESTNRDLLLKHNASVSLRKVEGVFEYARTSANLGPANQFKVFFCYRRLIESEGSAILHPTPSATQSAFLSRFEQSIRQSSALAPFTLAASNLSALHALRQVLIDTFGYSLGGPNNGVADVDRDPSAFNSSRLQALQLTFPFVESSGFVRTQFANGHWSPIRFSYSPAELLSHFKEQFGPAYSNSEENVLDSRVLTCGYGRYPMTARDWLLGPTTAQLAAFVVPNGQARQVRDLDKAFLEELLRVLRSGNLCHED